MRDHKNTQGADEAPENEFFDPTLQEHIVALREVPELDEDTVLKLTRRIRLRQVRVDLDVNGGEMPKDPEERKIFMQNLKELEASAAKIKMIGAKEKSNVTERLAIEALMRMTSQLDGRNLHERAPIEGQAVRTAPSIADAQDLPELEMVPDETTVGVADITYEEVFDKDE